jgi:hypothetical protein
LEAWRGLYRAPADEEKYAQALEKGNVETYKVTWATKLFSPEDVVRVLSAALEGRAKIIGGIGEAAAKFDCPGPRWGTELVKGSDPDAGEYEARHEAKTYNGGGMTVGLTPMGQLCQIRIEAYTEVKLRTGEVREILLAMELEYDACAQISTAPPRSLGYLLDGYFVDGWVPQYRNAKLSAVLGELDPEVGVKIVSKRVNTKAGYLLEVKAVSAKEDRMVWVRKQLIRGVELEWCGGPRQFEIGSHMDVEEHREAGRTSAATFRMALAKRSEGKQISIRNIKPEVVTDEGGALLRDIAKRFCDEGEELQEWVLRTARSGNSAYCWVTYRTEAELKRALAKNELKEQIMDAAGQYELCWRNDPIVELKTGVVRDGDAAAAAGEHQKWYAPPKPAIEESAVPTINVTGTKDVMAEAAAVLVKSMKSGELSGAVGELVKQAVDPYVQAVRVLTGDVAEWQKKVDRDAAAREKALRSEMHALTDKTDQAIEMLRRLLPKSERSSARKKQSKGARGRKRPASGSDSDSSEEEEMTMPSTRKPGRHVNRTATMEVDHPEVADDAIKLLNSVLAGLEQKQPGLAELVVKGSGLEGVEQTELWKRLFPSK